MSDPISDPEYQRWIAELAEKCTCSSPAVCAGLLAGGSCDDIQDQPDDRDDEEEEP